MIDDDMPGWLSLHVFYHARKVRRGVMIPWENGLLMDDFVYAK